MDTSALRAEQESDRMRRQLRGTRLVAVLALVALGVTGARALHDARTGGPSAQQLADQQALKFRAGDLLRTWHDELAATTNRVLSDGELRAAGIDPAAPGVAQWG